MTVPFAFSAANRVCCCCGSGYWPDHEALRAFSFPGQYLPPMGVPPFRLALSGHGTFQISTYRASPIHCSLIAMTSMHTR